MNTAFWARAHGGVTHFPVALVIAAAVFDIGAHLVKRDNVQRDLRVTAYWSIMLAALGACGAVLSGLFLSGGEALGAGLLFKHHIFVWASFGLIIALAIWRLFIPKEETPAAHMIYLAALVVAAVLVALAGYWGGEMMLGSS